MVRQLPLPASPPPPLLPLPLPLGEDTGTLQGAHRSQCQEKGLLEGWQLTDHEESTGKEGRWEDSASGPRKKQGNELGFGAASAHLMWKFCTLTFLYGAVFLWHQRRSPSLAEVSAKHTKTLSTGSDKTILLVQAEPEGQATRQSSSSSDGSNSPFHSRHGQASAEPNR